MPIGEAKVDGQSAPFFFRQAVSIDPGERLDQQSFAVIDMACGRDNHDNTSS
jgi:hypothetical protein